MSIYGEPKNGDFARYVEELSRRGMASAAPSPGEIPRRGRQAPDAAPAAPVPAATPAGAPAGQAPTLAQQASLRQSSSRQTFLGFVALCLAVWNLAAYVAQEHQSAARFIIPALVGFWLFRGAARKRARSRAAGRILPPLNLPPKP
ncbi:hypothetical protein [Bordetella pseudohinzii]|uniref:Uncharacterized protein n=1 Tax=Bordetella pseudohinzii TaxID=1331258 RepID=A0A0J6CAV9_9BORD|nr:hypothetical protein [Bordetella pseudohinzii]ANY16666.1 hypothetical protein BBN53_12660 [Bordetella pseudohinzii]KMM27831.1 membrane protein [Bordetella pseudohinzii]KXA77622.1 hypothetical protein AW878_14870 [Bordetella pseudohinzii]KXA81970.1 hypothetical protein AW877_03655 [Bordetella pseudohinzii]CUI29223.1 Uncharacterised protein [Bordetella pseudohinzii]